MDKVTRKKQQIIQAITKHLVANGLSDVGLRSLAAVGGTSDRMLIYYFGTKDELMGEVLQTLASGFALQLDAILGEHQRGAETLFEELWAISDNPEFLLIIRLWFEIVGQAARGREPYAENAVAIGNSWLAWTRSRLIPADASQATQLFAELEGRLMLKIIGVELT